MSPYEFVDLRGVIDCEHGPGCHPQKYVGLRVRVAEMMYPITPFVAGSPPDNIWGHGEPYSTYEGVLPSWQDAVSKVVEIPSDCGYDCRFSYISGNQCSILGSYCQIELRSRLPIWPNRCSFKDSATCPMMETKDANYWPRAEDEVFWNRFNEWNTTTRKGKDDAV
jgi:hypothetical protein